MVSHTKTKMKKILLAALISLIGVAHAEGEKVQIKMTPSEFKKFTASLNGEVASIDAAAISEMQKQIQSLKKQVEELDAIKGQYTTLKAELANLSQNSNKTGDTTPSLELTELKQKLSVLEEKYSKVDTSLIAKKYEEALNMALVKLKEQNQKESLNKTATKFKENLMTLEARVGAVQVDFEKKANKEDVEQRFAAMNASLSKTEKPTAPPELTESDIKKIAIELQSLMASTLKPLASSQASPSGVVSTSISQPKWTKEASNTSVEPVKSLAKVDADPYLNDMDKSFKAAQAYWEIGSYKNAIPIYEKYASEKESIKRLAEAYWNGYGVKQDKKKGLEYFEKAGEQYSDRDSLLIAAKAYYFGVGTTVNYSYARKLFNQSFNQGSYLSAYYLGYIDYSGNGVRQDLVSAHSWLALASSGDDSQSEIKQAKILYSTIDKQLDLSEKEESQKLVLERQTQIKFRK